MAITHSTAAGNALVNAVVDLLDTGTGNPDILWLTAADAQLCATVLDGTAAFGAASSKSAALAGVPLTSTGATAGTVAKAVFQDRDEAEVFRCAVGTSGSDINLSGVVLGTSETITLNSFTYSVV